MAVFNRLLFPAKAAAASPATTFTSYAIRSSFCCSSSSDLQSPSSTPPCVDENSLRMRRGGSERNVQWVFLGCPGVGKGTYAARLSKLLCVPHIATGDLVRHELASRGPLSSQVQNLFCSFIEIKIYIVSKKLCS